MKIGFIGLGKLGLPVALAIENRGFEVKGYDIDPKITKYLKERKVPYRERGIEDLLKKTKIELLSPEDLVMWADIIFVAVQTPHDPKYEGITRLPEERIDFDYVHLQRAIFDLNVIAGKNKKSPIVSVISTVLPGTIHRNVFPYSNNLKIVYNPFFIAMGTTMRDFLEPEIILLGVDNSDALEAIKKFYFQLARDAKSMAPVVECSIATAEAIKILYNTYITQKIVFANAAMELCYHTGADVDDIIDAMSLCHNRIISNKYMYAGMGDGGGCHPRDNIALSAIARRYHISYDWWENLMLAREKQTEFLARLIFQYWSEHKFRLSHITILGYSFKPDTKLTYGSPAVLLYNILCEYVPPQDIVMVDPYIDENWDKFNEEPGLYFIGTKHMIFLGANFPKGSIIIDPWRYILDRPGIEVLRIGEGK